MDSLIYRITPPHLISVLSFLNITYPVIPNSASDISVVAQDSFIPIMRGSICSTIMFSSVLLLTMLLAFKQTHV